MFVSLVEVPLPDLNKRIDILNRLKTKIPMNANINIVKDIAEKTERFSGADLAALLRQAATFLLKEHRERKIATIKRRKQEQQHQRTGEQLKQN